MRNKKFYDSQQASQYIRNTVFRVGEEPIYAYDVQASDARGHKLTVTYSALTDMNGTPQNINIDDKSIDMNPVPLGMTNYFNGEGHTALFVSRFPARKWKIGLAIENLSIKYLGGNSATGDLRRVIFPTKLLVNTIKGEYLSPQECMKQLKRYGGSIAFSRRFAVDSLGGLFYKDAPDKVGSLTTSGADLNPEFMFLKEILEEDINAHH